MVAGPDELLVFLHIPKAAGQTLNTVLRANFPSRNSVWVAAVGSAEMRAQITAGEGSLGRQPLRLLAGHFCFGIHRQLARQPEKVRYFTVIRHPVGRARSFYEYIRRNPNHYYHKQLVSSGQTFAEFAADPNTPELSNQQTRLIAGCNTAPDRIDEAELERAKRNIDESFVLAGLQERFDESLVLLKLLLGLKDINYVSVNVSERRTKAAADEDAVAVVEKRNHLDVELYRYCEQRMNRQIAEFGDRFTEEMRQFQDYRRGFRYRCRVASTTLVRDVRKRIKGVVGPVRGR